MATSHEDSGVVARCIIDRLGHHPQIPYVEVASKAAEVGKKDLAIKLLEHEVRRDYTLFLFTASNLPSFCETICFVMDLFFFQLTLLGPRLKADPTLGAAGSREPGPEKIAFLRKPRPDLHGTASFESHARLQGIPHAPTEFPSGQSSFYCILQVRQKISVFFKADAFSSKKYS